MSSQKRALEAANKAAKNVGDLDASAGSGKGAVGGAAGRAAKKAGKQKKVKRLSIFDRNNTEGIFSKSGAFKEGAADAVPEAVRSLLQSPDGGPTLNDLTRNELKSLHDELIASGNENLAHNLVKRTDKKKWKTPELKAAENAQPLPDDGSDVLAKANPDPNDLNGTTGKPRRRPVEPVTVTKPDGEEVKAVDSNTFRKQARPLPEGDLYQKYVSNGIKDVDLKNQLDALFKSPGLQAAYRADRGLDNTASIFAEGKGRKLSDDYKAWILEKSNDGGVDFFDKALASGRNNVPKRNAVPRTGIDKVTTPDEKGVSSASKIAGADVGAPASSEDFARRAMTEENVDPAELPGANVTAKGRKQATLPTDAKRQMGVEDLVQGLRDDASPEVLRIIAKGSDVESSEMAYKVVEAFLNRRLPTGDRVGEGTHRAAVQAGAEALAASLNRPPYTELHPSILKANDAATRIDIESGKKPIKGQPVEVSGRDSNVTATADGSTLTPGEDTRNILGSKGELRDNKRPRGRTKKKQAELDEQNFPTGDLTEDAATATKNLNEDPSALAAVPEDIVSPSKKAPKKAAPKTQPEVRDPNVERASKNSAQVAAAEDWLDQNGLDVEGYDDYEIMETFFDNYKAADAAPEAPKVTKAQKPQGKKQPTAGEPVADELPEVPESMKGETVSSLDDNRKAFTTANLRKYVEQTLVDNGMSNADAKKFVKQMDRKQLLNEYEASSGNNAVAEQVTPNNQYPRREPEILRGRSNDPDAEKAKAREAKRDANNAKRDELVEKKNRNVESAVAGSAMTTLALWMASQGMSGDDDEGKSTMQPGGSVDNPAMPQGAAAGGSSSSSAGGMSGGGGMSPIERIRAAQAASGNRYVAGLAGTQTVRGFR